MSNPKDLDVKEMTVPELCDVLRDQDDWEGGVTAELSAKQNECESEIIRRIENAKGLARVRNTLTEPPTGEYSVIAYDSSAANWKEVDTTRVLSTPINPPMEGYPFWIPRPLFDGVPNE
jgi:hypothetical protein